jgi:hypothetical protein
MIKQNFQHFLITSFNVDFNLKPREQILNFEYLEKRFKIFENLCYPSVVSQLNKNFQWLCFFDRETPELFREKIVEFARWKNFVPIFTDPVIGNHNIFQEAIQNYVVDDTNFIITTNLDNDDAIGKNFIQIIQNNFNEQEFEFINFPFGYMLRQDGLFLREFLSSPFLSLIERAENPITCCAIVHQDLFKLSNQGVPLRQIITHPTWIQLIHDSNVINHLDVNAVIQNPKRLSDNFVVGDLVKDYLKLSYSDSFFKFYKNFILKNKYNRSWQRKIRNIATTIEPTIPLVYLNWSSKTKNIFAKNERLSAERAKLICEQYLNVG